MHTGVISYRLLRTMICYLLMVESVGIWLEISRVVNNASSVVDVLIAQRDLIPLINYFKVLPFDWYSDHAVISACFAVTVNTAVAVPDGCEKVCNCFQNWNEDTKDIFLKKLSNPVVANKLNTFCETNFSGGNAAAEQFTVIMGGVIKSVFRRDRQKRPKLTNRKIPYNYLLQIAKRTFKKYKDQFAKDPENLAAEIDTFARNSCLRKLFIKLKRIAINIDLIRFLVWSKMIQNHSGKM